MESKKSEVCRHAVTVNRPTIPTTEALMRQHGVSYGLGNGWTVGFNREAGAWQVFWRGCDANFRLGVGRAARLKRAKYHDSFEAAVNWIVKLTEDDLAALARSV